MLCIKEQDAVRMIKLSFNIQYKKEIVCSSFLAVWDGSLAKTQVSCSCKWFEHLRCVEPIRIVSSKWWSPIIISTLVHRLRAINTHFATDIQIITNQTWKKWNQSTSTTSRFRLPSISKKNVKLFGFVGMQKAHIICTQHRNRWTVE